MRIHNKLIKPTNHSVLPYIIGTDAILLASSMMNLNPLKYLGLLVKLFAVGIIMPFSNDIETYEKTIELKTPINKIDVVFQNDTSYSVLTPKQSDLNKLKPFFDAFEKGDSYQSFGKILSISNSTLESTTFYSPSGVKYSFADYALVMADAILSYNFLEIDNIPAWVSVTPNILSMFMMKASDALVLFTKPKVDYFTLEYSDEPDSEGFYYCKLLDHHNEVVETATSVIV